MDIFDIDPATLPRDDFGPPLGGMPMEEYEKWNYEMLKPHLERLRGNPPPLQDGEPFVLKE